MIPVDHPRRANLELVKRIGCVDVHLLASTALNAGSMLWTRDKRLRDAAEALGCAHAQG